MPDLRDLANGHAQTVAGSDGRVTGAVSTAQQQEIRAPRGFAYGPRMRSLLVISSALLFAACGGGGSTNPTPDAPNNTVHDAPSVTPDSPPAAAGLGSKCGTGQPTCPAMLTCLMFQGAQNGFCSGVCHMGATFMTDAQGNIASTTVVPADNAQCQSIFTGSQGTPVCGVQVNTSPTPTTPIQKSTTFTFDAYCAVACGTANACPTGMTCDTQKKLCLPT